MSASAKFERWLAAAVFSLPLLYVLTDRSPQPFVARWSKEQLVLLAVFGLFLGVWLLSYRWSLPAWLGKLRRGIVAMSFGSVLALVGLELGVRAIDSAPFEPLDNRGRHAPDPDVGHVFYPNHEQVIQTREYRIQFRSNAQGVRADVDYGPKPANVVRVVCVGDSFTAGEQVELPETWPGVLEARLNADGGDQRYEVVNAGYPGFSAFNQATWLEKFGAQFEPDVVVLAATPNDLLENEVPLRLSARGGGLVRASATDQDELAWLARRQWYSLPGIVDRSFLMAMFRGSELARRLGKRPRFTHWRAYAEELGERGREQYESLRKDHRRARAAAAEMGASFALIAIPFREQLGDLTPGLDPFAFGRRLVEAAEQDGYPAADVLPVFRAEDDPATLYWREDGHCSAKGYARVGETAHRLLREHAEELSLP